MSLLLLIVTSIVTYTLPIVLVLLLYILHVNYERNITYVKTSLSRKQRKHIPNFDVG